MHHSLGSLLLLQEGSLGDSIDYDTGMGVDLNRQTFKKTKAPNYRNVKGWQRERIGIHNITQLSHHILKIS